VHGGTSSGRNRTGTSRHRPLIVWCVLGALFLLPVGAAQDGAEGEWRLVSRSHLGEEYAVDLSRAAGDDGAFPVNRGALLRFDLVWRENGSYVLPAPVLLVEAVHCDTGPPRPGLACDPERVAATTARSVLTPAEASPVYFWDVDKAAVFTAPGTWRLAVVLQGDPGGAAALFHVEAQRAVPDLGIPFVSSLLRALVGEDTNAVAQILAFLAWVGFFVVTGAMLPRVLRRTLLTPYRVDPTVGRLAGRLLSGVWVILGIAFSTWAVWRVNFWAGLAALGLLSVALGFGMQNTVANVMGGVNLALDKPFQIGDRVRIGDTWGDVEEVGIRSTRIVTVRKESVIIPNKLMDEREIWNFTFNQPELRRDIDVLISYDSDRRLAEALMLEAAREHKDILPYPRPRVFLRDFADSGLLLQLRCWIPDARLMRPIGSDLRKAIKDKFDANGVEIPFPYRTLVEKKELPAPKRASSEEVQEHVPPDVRTPRLLYANSGPDSVGRTAHVVARIAAELDMQLLVLHIQRRLTKAHRAQAYRVLSAFEAAARRQQVLLRTLLRQGHVREELMRAIQEERVDLVVIGSSRSPFHWAPRRVAALTREIRDSLGVPVLIVPRDLRIGPRALEHFRQVVEQRIMARQRSEADPAPNLEGEEEDETKVGEEPDPEEVDPDADKGDDRP
jgi:small-conductance mechanosensitive channel/nucleotide-binding universal stress UspA family protein